MPALRFRRATAADVPLVAALNQQLQIDESHRLRMELTELEPRTARWLRDEGYEATVFERDGETAGYALYRREEDHYYLKQFFVCRHCRRQGVGRQAMDWLIEHVWHDAPAVYLDVLVTNAAGIAFWRAVGFQDYCVTMERKTTHSN
jgi:ribosomal protein S18 acetylase RimI-like enzyme